LLNRSAVRENGVLAKLPLSLQQVADKLLTCWKHAPDRLQIRFQPVGTALQTSVFCINGAYYVKTEPVCCIFMQKFHSVSTFSAVLKNGGVGRNAFSLANCLELPEIGFQNVIPPLGHLPRGPRWRGGCVY